MKPMYFRPIYRGYPCHSLGWWHLVAPRHSEEKLLPPPRRSAPVFGWEETMGNISRWSFFHPYIVYICVYPEPKWAPCFAWKGYLGTRYMYISINIYNIYNRIHLGSPKTIEKRTLSPKTVLFAIIQYWGLLSYLNSLWLPGYKLYTKEE